jgi:hypothetical protein
MRPLSAAQLLDAWERGLSEPACRRAIPVLATAYPDYSHEALAELSIGERDRRLLTVRQWTFGSQLASVANCSGCGEGLEWTVDAEDLHVQKPELSGDLTVETEGYRVAFRLPNSLDLTIVSGCKDAASARLMLLEKCISSARLGGEDVSSDLLPVAVTSEVVRRMAEADPQADIEVELSCPSCGQHWQVIFDIESFFWSEISAWAQRILSEVHVLARAYGWSETHILTLSPWRRQVYLNLVGA